MFQGSLAEKRLGKGLIFGALPIDVFFMGVMKKRFIKENPGVGFSMERCKSPTVDCEVGEGGYMFEHTGFFTKTIDQWGYAEAYYIGLLGAPFILLGGLWFLLDYKENKSSKG